MESIKAIEDYEHQEGSDIDVDDMELGSTNDHPLAEKKRKGVIYDETDPKNALVISTPYRVKPFEELLSARNDDYVDSEAGENKSSVNIEEVEDPENDATEHDLEFLELLTEKTDEEAPISKQMIRLVAESVEQSRRDIRMENQRLLRTIARRLCGNKVCNYMKRDGLCGMPARTKVGLKWYCAGDHTRRGKEKLDKAKIRYLEVTRARGIVKRKI